jgi:hypothetical protein
MLLFKRLLTSCILFLLLSLAGLIVLGVIVGAHGGIGWPKGPGAFHDVTRQYGAVVFLSTLSVSALAALVISFSGILPWCRKKF